MGSSLASVDGWAVAGFSPPAEAVLGAQRQVERPWWVESRGRMAVLGVQVARGGCL